MREPNAKSTDAPRCGRDTGRIPDPGLSHGTGPAKPAAVQTKHKRPTPKRLSAIEEQIPAGAESIYLRKA